MLPDTAAVLGGGVIGAGWVARLIENGVEVRVFDPDPEAARKLDAVLENADRAYARLTMAPRGRRAAWRIAPSVILKTRVSSLSVSASASKYIKW